MSHMGLNFDLSSFVSYYPMLRLFGYTFEASYSPINRTLQSWHLGGLRKRAEQNIGETLTKGEQLALKVFADKPLGMKTNPFDVLVRSEGVFGDQDNPLLRNTTYEKAQEDSARAYKGLINKTEAVAFTGLAAKHSFDAYRQLLENFKLAVGAEIGKDPKDVAFSDLRRSNNPVVVSAVDRFMWQAPLRIGAGVSFLPGLAYGIMANSVVITAERTIFYRPVAYDILAKAVNDVQINSLGQEAKGEVVDNLIRVMQAQRFDHRQALIPSEQVEALRPTLDLIADDVVSKRFGISGMVYIMGGGTLIPEDPAQSMTNYLHVRDVGVSGVMEEAKQIRALTHAPSTRIWDAQLAQKQQVRPEGFVAESARREELIRERRAILARGPLHATPGSEIDSNARYGGGIQIY